MNGRTGSKLNVGTLAALQKSLSKGEYPGAVGQESFGNRSFGLDKRNEA
jgi:hypothetical protein